MINDMIETKVIETDRIKVITFPPLIFTPRLSYNITFFNSSKNISTFNIQTVKELKFLGGRAWRRCACRRDSKCCRVQSTSNIVESVTIILIVNIVHRNMIPYVKWPV